MRSCCLALLSLSLGPLNLCVAPLSRKPLMPALAELVLLLLLLLAELAGGLCVCVCRMWVAVALGVARHAEQACTLPSCAAHPNALLWVCVSCAPSLLGPDTFVQTTNWYILFFP